MAELGRLPPRRRPPCKQLDPARVGGGVQLADCGTCGGLKLASQADCGSGWWRRFLRWLLG